MSLTTCVRKAGKNLNAEDKAAILEAARANRKAGMSTDDAAKAAVRARLEEVQALLAAEGQVVTVTTQAEAPKTLKERAEAMAAKPDKAEIRPFRRADGSIGYEAAPIPEAQPTTGPVAAPAAEATKAGDRVRTVTGSGKTGKVEKIIDGGNVAMVLWDDAPVVNGFKRSTAYPIDQLRKVAAPAAADPTLDDELSDALGKLGDVLGDVFGAKKNITGPQYGAADLLPALSKVVELLVRKGFKSFAQAAGKAAALMRANEKTAAHVDAITPRQWKAAYNAIAEGTPGTDTEEALSAMTADQVKAIVGPADSGTPAPAQGAQNAAIKESTDDTRGNGADDAEPLDPQLPAGNPELAEGVAPETSASVRQPDAAGNGRSGGKRAGRRTGMDRGEKPVLPQTPAEVRPTSRSPVAGEPDAQNQLFGDAPGNYEITADDGIGEGTEGQKLRANMEAIRTLRRIQADNRNATPEEQATMAKFIGWGGLRKLIDPNTTGKQWLDARAELLGTNGQPPLLVGGDKGSEWIALQRSTTAAHFTAPEIVTAMWGVVRHFGFAGGRVLEPTSGIGNFIGLQPRDLAAASEWHGAELDILTGQMAKLIYPEASIAAGIGFENVPFAKGAFALAIGNPPFGSLPLSSDVAAYKGIPTMKIHNFIISKTGEHLRPGGVMAMVVTHRFLDTANPEAREHLAKTFRFLGAFRLPNDAFLKNAGTEVTTDVIFLQKLHVGEKATDLSWLDTEGSVQVDGQGIRVNRYYEKNPANILGRSAMDGTMYAGRQEKGGEYTVHSDGRDLTKAIADLLENQWADLKDVAKPTNDDASAAAVMIQQSDLPVGGVMLDANGKLLRRDMDDEGGNAVVVEVTPQSLWRDGAEKWKRALDVLTTFKNKNLLTVLDGMVVFKEAIAVAYTAKGEKKPKPTKAEQAVYDIADALDRPGFAWRFDAQLDAIQAAVQRGMLGEDGYARLKGLVGLRNTTLQLIEAERRDQTADMKEIRSRLNAEYDAFVASYGLVNEPANAGLLDGDIGVESGLEAGYRAKNGKVKASANKADIFTRRVNFPYREVTSAKDAADGLQVSLSERGRLDIPYIAKLTGQTSQQVIAELSGGENPSIFLNPDTNEYTDADQYLSGNVKVKLRKAKDAGLRQNVRALEAVQPAPKTKDNVRPSIRGAWMPESLFQEFLTDLGAISPRVSIIASQGMILGSSDSVKETEFGSQFKNSQKSVVELFNSAASGKPITIWNTDSKGNRIKNEVATKEVNLLVERMAKVFNEWAWSSETRVQQVVDAFNEKMNTHVARQYDGNKYLRPVGASPSIELRTTQKNAAWRIVQAPTVLLDHVVGAGKTYTVITGAMQRRRLGLSRKPMIVVPNHLVTQWARDFYALYPGAKILAATPDDFAKNRRRRLFSRIATGDFDAVIIGHSSLAFIETPLADQQLVINEQIKELQDVLNELKRKKESGRTLTQIQEKLQKYEGKLKELQDVRRDEIGIDLEKMGVDYLAVDEMHEFKNLEYSTAGERVVGMNDPKGSKKAFDLYLKTRGLLARGGAVTGATGTPVSNSLVELYTMMKYLAHQDLVDRSQLNFDAWSGAYARTETKLEYTATQKLKPRRVLAGLNNLSALKQLYEQFADVISMRDLKRIHAEDIRRKNAKDGTTLREGFPVPKVKTGGRLLESGPITEAQSTYMDYLVARMQAIEANKRNKEYARIDNPLYVLTDARKMSLDIRIVDPTAPRDANGKVMRAAANVFNTYKTWDKDRGTQMIFCDLSTPAKNAVKEARSLIRESVEKLFGGGAEGKRLLARITALPTFSEQWRLLESMAQEVIEAPNTDTEIADKMEEYLAGLEDVDATMTTADVGFSVYDDMRAALVEKGIPEAEIAFIHDFNTPEQKAKLFADVNDGTIRVLMGSSAKMGAGTNAQRRLVALHHMDAPWRPSDVEQREGRIIRQNNALYERDPDGFEVDIRAYSTAGTSDAVMWQVLERKSRAIEEFRNAGLDHTDEEGSDSNQYAEFMAQSTGNPVFKLKLEAERAVDLLDTDSRGALLARSQAQRFLQTYDEDVASAQAAVDYAAKADVSTVEVAGQKGTEAEFEAVMAAARQKYDAAVAVYWERKAEYDKELAAWSALTELERGEKPKLPAGPSMTGLLSKSVQNASGYARAITAALSRATASGYAFTFGTLRMRVRQSILAEDQWVLQAWNGYTYETHAYGEGKTADASSTLANALAPDALRSMARSFGYEGERRLRSLKEQYDTKVKLAAKNIDTRKLEQAKEAMEWLRSQVSFAEQQADIRRGERPNRYIQGDKKRPLSQARVEAGEQIAVDFEGEVFQLTGFRDGIYMQAVGADGREVLLRMPPDKNGKRNAEKLIEKPSGVTFSGLPNQGKTKGKSTNLRQTGSPEANDTDVVFSRTMGPTFPTGTVSPRLLSAEVAKITANWDTDLATVKVVNTVEDLPAAIRQAVKNVGAENQVRGLAMPTGDVFLVAENIGSVEEGRFVLFHEVYGHVGMRAFLGDGYSMQMRTLKAANPSLAREAEAWFSKYGEVETQARIDAGMTPEKAAAAVRDLAVEEALADRAGDAPAIKGWQRLMAALQRALRRMGLGSVADMLEGMSEAETLALLVDARRTVSTESRGSIQSMTSPVFQRAYHGTAARVDKFSTDYMGTGEGAQAYGWGLYFASKREVADFYRKKLSAGGDYTLLDGKRWRPPVDAPASESARLDNMAMFMLQQAQSAAALEVLAKRRDADPAVVQRARELLPRVTWEPSGQLYEVDIPEDSEMLLWDKPLSEQPAKVREALKSLPKYDSYYTGGRFYEAVSSEWASRGGSKAASEALMAAGVKGIKYLDGDSRGAGDGTFNYVVFSGDDVAIREQQEAMAGVPAFSRATAQTATDAFKRWFGASVVTKDGKAGGEPLVVYHGTAADIDSFSAAKIGAATDSGGSGRGFYFAADPEYAGVYAGRKSGANIVPAYVSLKNPLQYEAGSFGGRASAIRSLGLEVPRGDPTQEWSERFTAAAQAKGYDGVLVTLGGKPAEVVAFRPEQIKSAVGNSGAFSPTNADIRFSRLTSQDILNPGGGVQDFSRYGKTKQDRLRGIIDKGREFYLGALTRDQIADVYGGDVPQVRDYDKLVRSMENERSSLAQRADEVYQRWAKIDAATSDKLGRIMLDATTEQVHPDSADKPADPAKAQIHARLRAQFKLLPPEVQAMYREVRDFHAGVLDDIKTALVGRIERQVAAGAERAALLSKVQQQFDQYLEGGPYFPLSRFGDYLVIATRPDGERVVAAYENAGEQQAAARELRADGFTTKMKTAKEYARSQDGNAGKFIGDVIQAVEKVDMVEATINGSRTDLKNQLLDDLNQLFIRSLPDLSYRKHFAHRKNTPGFSADVMRGFASSAFHAASYIARLNHADRMTMGLQSAYEAIDKADEGDFNTQTQVLNELSKRHESMLNPNTHPLSAAATQLGFVMYLGLSPAAGLINMLQVPMVTIPYLGAKYGFGKASAAMGKAYADIMKAPANRQSGFNAAQSLALSAEERKAISTLQDEGVIDLTQAHDLAAATDRDVGDLAKNKTAFAMARAMRIVGWTFHVPEVMNRQTTALMAYRLERERGADHETALEQARETIKRTQFDYSSSNRARYMQGNIARVVLQFKQFSQNMTYFLGRAAYQALKGESPEVRKIARRQILSTFVVTGTMAGSLGLPGIGAVMGAVGMLVSAMDDEDEPWDWQTEYRNALADQFGKEWGEVFAKGAPRMLMPWWDIAGRVSLNELWWRSNDREGQNPREAFATDMANILGPTAGTLLGWYTAADHMQRGAYDKAAEAVVPKFIRDPLKAYREADEGVTSYNGDPLMDVEAVEVFGRAMGFAPTRVSEMFEGRNAVMNAKTALDERRQRLLNKVVKARMDGDREAEAEARSDIAGFNSRNPDFKITNMTIARSLMTRRRNRENTEQGILLPDTKADLRERGRFANIE